MKKYSLLAYPITLTDDHTVSRNKGKISRDVYLLFVSSIASCSAFLQGYILTLSGILILDPLFLNEVSNVGEFDSSAFAVRFLYLYYLGSILGSFFSFLFSDVFGRRTTLFLFTIACIICLIWSTLSASGANLLTSRFGLGCIIGILVSTSAVYISEISTPSDRGKSLALMNFFEIAGSIICGLFYLSFWDVFETSWKLDLLAPIVILLFQVVILYLLPESPRWVLAHKTPAECLVSLRQLRRTNDVSREFNGIYRALSHDARLGDNWYDILTHRSVRYRLRLIVLLQLTQHFVGLPAITIYAGAVLARVGVLHYLDLSLSCVYLSAFLGAVAGVYKIDTWGRRFLLIMGYTLLSLTWLCAAGCITAGGLDASSSISNPISVITNNNSTSTTIFTDIFSTIMPTTIIINIPTETTIDPIHYPYAAYFRILFIFFFSCIAFLYCMTLGACLTTISAELFPLRARGKTTGAALSLNTFSAGLSAYIMKSWLSEAKVSEEGQLTKYMMIFAGISFIIVLFVIVILPETKGLMLEDMEELFDMNPVTNVSSSIITTSGATSTITTVINTTGVISGVSSTTNGNNSNSGTQNGTSMSIASSGSVGTNTNTNWLCNLCGAYANNNRCTALFDYCTYLCYYCSCCCPAVTTRGLMGYRKLPDKIYNSSNYANNSNNYTSINSSYNSVSYNIQTRDSKERAALNSRSRNNSRTNLDVNNIDGNNINNSINHDELILYNPATLHKYSGEMRESKFLYFDEENGISERGSGRIINDDDEEYNYAAVDNSNNNNNNTNIVHYINNSHNNNSTNNTTRQINNTKQHHQLSEHVPLITQSATSSSASSVYAKTSPPSYTIITTGYGSSSTSDNHNNNNNNNNNKMSNNHNTNTSIVTHLNSSPTFNIITTSPSPPPSSSAVSHNNISSNNGSSNNLSYITPIRHSRNNSNTTLNTNIINTATSISKVSVNNSSTNNKNKSPSTPARLSLIPDI